MTELLPVGTIVTVTEPKTDALDGRTYMARVVGYDMHHSKYELGLRYASSGSECLYTAGGWWAFPSWVQPAVDE